MIDENEMTGVPDGWRPVRCYTNGKQLKVLYDELDLYPGENHNCDERGCGTISHVIATFDLPDTKEHKL